MVRMPLVEHLFYDAGSNDDDSYRRAALEWLYGCDTDGELNLGASCAVAGCVCQRPGQGARKAVCRKAILCTTNEARDAWNDYVSRTRAEAGDATPERTYTAFHEKSVAANVDVTSELLASALGEDDLETLRHDASVPAASVTFRVGDDVLLMQTMDKSEGLVNNVRLKVVQVRANSVLCALEHEHGVATQHVIYRRPFTIEVGRSGISVVRKQIPLVRAYALTINKSQGQTLDRVLFDARRHAHQHGHTYVLFSRVRTRGDLGAVVDASTCETRGNRRVLLTANVLYEELLSGQRAAGQSGSSSCQGATGRDCARCGELMYDRVGTMLCQACEDEVDLPVTNCESCDEEASEQGAGSDYEMFE